MTDSQGIYEATIWDETYKIKADWSDAASQIMRDNCDGEWEPTGYQVADFRHSHRAAMKRELELSLETCGGDPADEEIEAALDDMDA